jgi:ferredoxin-type protein NapH
VVVSSIPQITGLIYAIIALPVIAWLWYKGKMTRVLTYLFLGITMILGFLIFSPMVPHQFQQALIGGGPGPGTPLPMVLGLMLVFILLTYAAGRIFCAQLCPVGAVQELFYTDPRQKATTAQKKIIMVIRGVYFIVFIVAGVLFSVALLRFFGIKEFFYLEFSATFFSIFIVIIAISLFFYRPFCRLVCPAGVLFSLAAAKSLFKIRRTPACIQCGKCEQVCPTAEAGADDAKMECYLCGRCTRACPVEGVLKYSRETLPPVKKDER